MTLRDKLRIEHPECIGDIWFGGCKDCPKQYGYTKDGCCDSKTVNDDICRECWDRKYEGELTPQEKKIEELEKKIENQERYERLYRDRIAEITDESRFYCNKFRDLCDYITKKTGNNWAGWASKDTIIKTEFNNVFEQRNRWRLAFFCLGGLIIGNIIATFFLR